MATRNVPLPDAGPRVEDVMLRDPRTVAPETTVAAARETFENPRVRLLLVASGDAFLGAVRREGIDAGVAGDTPLGELAPATRWCARRTRSAARSSSWTQSRPTGCRS